MYTNRLIMLAGLTVLGLSWLASSSIASEREILLQKNLAPVAQVNVAGAALKAANLQPVAATGEEIYNKTCVTCHAAGVAGAPIFGDKAAWAPRVQSLGVAGLVKTAISGVRAMPPKGGCMSCSDADIKVAVEYMIKKSS